MTENGNRIPFLASHFPPPTLEMPKSFKFRMQTILDHKQDLEDKEKEKLAKILQRLEQANQYLANLEYKKEVTRLELKEKQRAGELDIISLQIYNQFLKKLDHEVLNVKLMIEQIKAEEREQRQNLLKAAQERQTFEKLKEKHHEQFKAEEAEKERKLIDDLTTIKFARKRMEEQQREEAIAHGDYDEDYD